MAYKNGDAVFAEDINKAIDDSTTAVNTANTAKTASDKASADVVDLAKQIGTKQGTTVTVGGVAQNAVAFTIDPQEQLTTIEANKVSIVFTDSTGAQNHVGKNVGSMTLDSGTHIFTNCTGAVNLIGNTAKIYAVNSPNLIITGKNVVNWRNISVDGRSEFVALNKFTPLIGTNLILLKEGSCLPGDMITISIRSIAHIQASTQLVTMKHGQGTEIARVGLTTETPVVNTQYYLRFTIYTNLHYSGAFMYNGIIRDDLFAVDYITIWRDNQ